MKNPLTKLQCAFAVYVEKAADDEAAWDRFSEAFDEYVAVMEETVNPYESACIKFLEAGSVMIGESNGELDSGAPMWDEAVQYFERLKGV